MIHRNARGLRSLLLSFSLLGLVAGTSSLALAQAGTAGSWGSDSHGQLGNGAPNADSNAPVTVSTVTDFVAIAGGKYHSLGVKVDGTVRSWGRNDTGQLGNGNTTNSASPVVAANLTGILAVAAGETHSLALKNDGTVWTWGGNSNGQLGDGSTSQRNNAVQVMKDATTALNKVVQVAAGGSHSLALLSDGSVWTWGNNSRGQLGIGSTTQKLFAVKATDSTTASLGSVINIAGGFQHSVAVKVDGTVWGWGSNGFKQLGDGTITDRTRAIAVPGVTNGWQAAAGDTFSVVLQSGGTAMAWGYNTSGQLAVGSGATYVGPSTVAGLAGVVEIASGNRHTVAVAGDGTVWAWGRNDKGQVGDGTNGNKNAPTKITSLTNQTSVAAGFEHSLTLQAVKRDLNANGSNLIVQYGARITTNGLLSIGTLRVPILQRSMHYKIGDLELGSNFTNYAGRAPVVTTDVLAYHVGTIYKWRIFFDGDRLYNGVTSIYRTITVTPAGTKLYGANAVSEIGATPNLKTLLRRLTDATSLVGMTVGYDIAGNSLGSAVTGADGRSSLPFKINESMGVGEQTVNVNFAGDADHQATTATLTLTINKGRTAFSVNSTSGKVGATVKLKAILLRSVDRARLAGKTINFMVNGVAAGSGVSAPDGTVAVDFVIPGTLTVGSVYPIAASWNGDALYLYALRDTATLTVK